jgi:hypothetical protein
VKHLSEQEDLNAEIGPVARAIALPDITWNSRGLAPAVVAARVLLIIASSM